MASWLPRARSLLLAALGAQVAVLFVTGVALFFLYRPTADQAWADVVRESYAWDVRMAMVIRALHRLASALAIPTAVALGVVVAVRRGWAGRALGAGIALATLLASFTGFLLPWDQLALWAVKAGSDVRGYTALFDPVVRFVLIGGVEVSRGTVLRWLGVHALVLGPVVVALLVLAWRRAPVTGDGGSGSGG